MKTCDAKVSASPPIGWPGPRAADTHTGTGSRTIGGRGPLNGGRSLDSAIGVISIEWSDAHPSSAISRTLPESSGRTPVVLLIGPLLA